jgi:nicotinate-nucleotide adenylyltransferase
VTDTLEHRKVVLLMGGTFDPVHHGHLRSALELKAYLNAAEVRLIPCGTPVHRAAPIASASQRVEMLKLAVDAEPGFLVDEREIARPSSFTVDTLISLRDELGDQVSLVWVMGSDAFSHFKQWRQWQRILTLAHILVVERAGEAEPVLSSPLSEVVKTFSNPEKLQTAPAGKICRLALTPLYISSTRIRTALKSGLSARFLLPDAVIDYINQHKLYG